MESGTGFFIGGFIFFVLGAFSMLRKDSAGVKDVVAIANSKNGEIGTLMNNYAEAFRLINSLEVSVKSIKNRCDSAEAALQEKTVQVKEIWNHTEAMTRSTNLELELLKQASRKQENLAIDLFFYEGNKKSLGQRSRERQVSQ